MEIVIDDGASTMEVAAALEQYRLIPNRYSFYLKVQLMGYKIMAGTYILNTAMTYDEILDQIAKIHKERGITVILVSHSMEDVANYVQRIIVMNDGEVALDDVPKRVFRYAKELDSIGLAVPQVTAVMNSLRDAGIPTGKDATTVEEARDELLQLYRKQR